MSLPSPQRLLPCVLFSMLNLTCIQLFANALCCLRTEAVLPAVFTVLKHCSEIRSYFSLSTYTEIIRSFCRFALFIRKFLCSGSNPSGGSFAKTHYKNPDVQTVTGSHPVTGCNIYTVLSMNCASD